MGLQPGTRDRQTARTLLEVPWESAGTGELLGPSPLTLRDPARPRSWLGLQEADRALLYTFVRLVGRVPRELHTHVPVGCVPKLRPEYDTEQNRRLVAGVYPRRVDMVLRYGESWWLVEGKVDARHYVLGQVLCYMFWWSRALPGRRLDRVVVVTDEADPDIRAVMLASGVDLVELGKGTKVAIDPFKEGLIPIPDPLDDSDEPVEIPDDSPGTS